MSNFSSKLTFLPNSGLGRKLSGFVWFGWTREGKQLRGEKRREYVIFSYLVRERKLKWEKREEKTHHLGPQKFTSRIRKKIEARKGSNPEMTHIPLRLSISIKAELETSHCYPPPRSLAKSPLPFTAHKISHSWMSHPISCILKTPS